MPIKKRRNYDYSRAGICMVTLLAKPGVVLCAIHDNGAVRVTRAGRAIQQNLPEITRHYPQMKIGQYQLMPQKDMSERERFLWLNRLAGDICITQ